MAEASTGSGAAPESQSAAKSERSARTALERREQTAGGLQTERGSTSIADSVVTKVASIAARDVAGVYALGGGAARAVGSVTKRVGIGSQHSQGVSVEVGEKQTAVDLTIVVEYGESIPTLSQQIRDNVTRQIEGITGLAVTEVNMTVSDLHFAGDEQPDDEPARVQ